jgi:hypothetical protein
MLFLYIFHFQEFQIFKIYIKYKKLILEFLCRISFYFSDKIKRKKISLLFSVRK